MLSKLSVADLDCRGRRVFVRVDFNVPLDAERNVTDDRRIRAALPTIRLLLEQGAIVVLGSHLGRPKGRVVEELRMTPVAARLSELLERPVTALDAVVGDAVEAAVSAAQPGDVLLLENLRFEPGEEKGDPDLAARMARLCDVFVGDAFGAAHRAHASVSVLPGLVDQAAAGLLMAAELEHLGGALGAPERPFVLVFGGAKVSDKVPVLRHLLERVDVALIGGGMAYTFLAAQGVDVGGSRMETDLVATARDILAEAEQRGVRIVLPHDHVIAEKLEPGAEARVSEPGIPVGWMGLDIGPASAARYAEEVAAAKTVLWNGPMGVFEIPPFDAGTRIVGQAIAQATDGGATSVVGGGDTAAAAQVAGVAERMTHVSTGGGASLEFLEGNVLPGVAALNDAAETDA
jgi:phosphoglycerate kinase